MRRGSVIGSTSYDEIERCPKVLKEWRTIDAVVALFRSLSFLFLFLNLDLSLFQKKKQNKNAHKTQIYGAGVALTGLATIPNWPWLNRNPLTWLPVEEKEEKKENDDDKDDESDDGKGTPSPDEKNNSSPSLKTTTRRAATQRRQPVIE